MPIIGDLSGKVVERLSQYRQLLLKYRYTSGPHINSSDLSRLTGATQESVRRDLMLIGCQSSNIRKGYQVQDMIDSINAVLDPYDKCRMALVGDNDAFTETLLYEYENELIRLVAIFDFEALGNGIKRGDLNRFHFGKINEGIKNLKVNLVILDVPGAFTRQTADIIVQSGVRGIVNMSSVKLDIPGVYIENINIITSIEKATFFMKWRQYV
jgi:redox-sensing transcriptional repressor